MIGEIVTLMRRL